MQFTVRRIPRSAQPARWVAMSVVAILVCWGTATATAGPLNDYNLIVLGNLTSSSEVEGKTFVGGNLSSSSSNYGIHLTVPPSELSLIVGGSITSGNIQLNKGSMIVGGNVAAGVNVNMNSGGNYAIGGLKQGNVNGGSQVPFTSIPDVLTMQTELLSLANSYASLAPNSTTSIQHGNQLIFDAVPAGPQNRAVFNVAAIDIFQNNSLAQLVLNVNGADEIIINVSGSSVLWNNGMNQTGSLLTDAVRERVVWNFYEATDINLGRNLNGALLAPQAHLTSSTNIDGSVAVASFTQNGEVHLPTSVLNPVPEPASVMLGLLALPGLLLIMRRRQR